MEWYLRRTVRTYDEIVSDYVQSTAHLRPQAEFEAFCQAIEPRGLVIDAGCAWGRDCRAFHEAGFDVVGIDLSDEMLKYARNYAPGCLFMRTDVRHIPSIEAVVDGIWCCATLLHLKRTQVNVALKEFYRVLRPGGICYIQLKSGTGQGMTRQSFAQSHPRYFTYFTLDEMTGCCEFAGFSLVAAHSYNERERNGREARDQDQVCVLARKR